MRQTRDRPRTDPFLDKLLCDLSKGEKRPARGVLDESDQQDHRWNDDKHDAAEGGVRTAEDHGVCVMEVGVRLDHCLRLFIHSGRVAVSTVIKPFQATLKILNLKS